MRRHRKWTACALIVALLLPLLAPFLTLLPQKTGAEELNFGNAHITPYQNKDASGNVEGPPTWRYAVGFMSYDIWRNSSGVWSPKAPGDPVLSSDGLKWTYTFSFPGRVVRSVEAYKFVAANSEHREFFEGSRGTPFDPYADYVSSVSNVDITNDNGIGTSSISFDLSASGTLSGNPRIIPCDSCNEGVQGLRYYFPIVFKFELDGLKTTRFFSTTGEKLRDEEKTNMEKGRTISTTPPAISGYRYVGYKKSTDGNSPAGEIIPGPPPSFVYDGNFDTYIVQLYYEPGTAPDKPDLVAVDITANGPIEVGKPANFTAKWRLDQKSLAANQCYNVKVMEGANTVKIQQYCGTQQGQQLTMSFSYTFTSTAQKTFLLVVDSANAVAESNENNNQLSRSFKAVDPAKTFTGDFDVTPSVIEFREPFQLKPKNFSFAGCTYDGHRYKIERGESTAYTSWANSQSQIHSYSYSHYPWVIGIGTHTITLEIRTKECGSAETATHTLVVNGPTTNHPPDFLIGFVHPHNPTKPVYEVVEGTVMDLIYINDPTVPTPYDPDGDFMEFLGFDFSTSSSWAKTIPQISTKYEDGYHGIVMNGLGYHQVKATMRDAFGATTTRTTYINVIPKNPIPVIEGPNEVKEGRPLPQPFSSAKSYSPAGRTIDHSKDEWGNMKDVYTTPGKEIITLHVYDSQGLKSLEPARHELTVIPDEPPVAKLEIEPLGVRNQTYYVYNKSYSPDGDNIVSVQYRMRYDDENNGFEDDPWMEISGDITRASFRPERVGKYQFYVRVCEDYGKCGDTLSEPIERTVIDILNLAPEVSFRIEGSNPQPDLSPEQVYTPSMMYNWTLTQVNSTTALPGKPIRWRVENGELRGLLGKKAEVLRGFYSVRTISGTELKTEWFTPLSDLGYGTNGLSPYRPIKEELKYNSTMSSGQPLLKPVTSGATTTWEPFIVGTSKPFRYTTTNTHMYFTDSTDFYALNKSKVGEYERISEYDNGFGRVKHVLPNGSYYDYIIKQPAFTDTRYYAKVRYGSESWEFFREENRPSTGNLCVINVDRVAGYFWTDTTLYQLTNDSGKCSYSNGEYKMTYFTAIRTYDLKTGEFIGSTFDFGMADHSLNVVVTTVQRGDAIVFLQNQQSFSNGYSTYSLVATTYDRSGRLVKTQTLNRVPAEVYDIYEIVCAPRGIGASFLYEGIDNDLYFYDQLLCVDKNGLRAYHVYEKAFITKYDANFNVVWRKQLQGRQTGPYDAFFYTGPTGGLEFMVVNPIRSEVVTWSYSTNGFDHTTYIQAFDMTTGATKSFHASQYIYDFYGPTAKFGVDWSGSYYTFEEPYVRLSTSAYGNFRTLIRDHTDNYTFTQTGTQQYPKFTSGGIVSVTVTPMSGYAYTADFAQYGEYIGDGMYLSLLDYVIPGIGTTGGRQMGTWVPWLNIGTPANATRYGNGAGMTLGQLLSGVNISNHELSFSLSIDDADADRELVGMSFRASDAANRYALETDGAVLYLSRYVNGARTVLAQTNYPFQDEVRVNFRIRAAGDKLDVYVNGVPYLSVTDSTYGSGKFGPFSHKPYVRFGSIKTKAVQPQEIVWDTAYAIWEAGSAKAEVRYNNIVFADPENDPPAGSYEWSVTHTPRFLNNQGLSLKHGQTFSSPVLEFDKVGDYTVILQAKDDPHPEHPYPDPAFEAYRQPSNAFAAIITVHRRPIADKSHAIAADGTILWTDRSYDPDRWISDTAYSTEPTGIDYKTTRGILEKKFYYITPSGTYVAEKLVVPQELGTYEIGMAVKDEYGAWSEYDVDFVTVTKLPEPNEPPHAGFTVSTTSTYRGVAITIDSTAWDKEDGDRTKLPHEYYIANASGTETLAGSSRTGWTKTFNTLGTFRIRQVVTDSVGQTDQAIQTVTVVNRKPQAVVTNPSGTSSANPTRYDILRPTFTWTYSDADGDAQTQYQVQIHRTNGALERDSGTMTGSVKNWAPASDLPERVTLYVQVRVHDGYEWSDWSAPKYFYIETNRPPVADFDWTPKPVYEGDTVRLIDRSSDPDGDPLTYDWQITGPGGVNLAFTAKEPNFRAEQPGNYAIRLTVGDGKATAQANRTLHVLPLEIAGEVLHTPEWRENHLAAGHEVERDPKDFYSGEIIRVAAEVSAAPVSAVTAELRAVSVTGAQIRKKVTLAAAGGLRYEGELHDKVWMSPEDGIREGGHVIVFRAEYQNGVVKETSVPIRIIGNIYRHVSVHRVQ